MRAIPAQAIIAALSVHSAKGGATNSKPSAAAAAASPARRLRLAATPPATAITRSASPGCASLSRTIARRVLAASTSRTACWNDAQRSATSRR